MQTAHDPVTQRAGAFVSATDSPVIPAPNTTDPPDLMGFTRAMGLSGKPRPGAGLAFRAHTVPPEFQQDFQHAKEQIKLRVPIEEVVRERVPGLKKRGRLWTACCPFHEEKSPSFKVDPSRGTWRCYGACAVGGDVISFLQKHDHLDFIETLETLGARCGVALPERSGAVARKARGADDPLYAVLERATGFYQRMLHRPEGAAALAYLRGRGLSGATIEAFGLGFSPAGGEVLVSKVLSQGEPLEPLFATGLARRNDAGRAYDFFRGRLMIPIRDDRGRTVGFGARRLDDSDPQSPKYVNTGETEVFHKGRLIYALDHAQAEIRRSGRMVLVEGYTDVMAAHQCGLRHVVAVLGTALTDEHAALVRRTGAKRVTLCFDGDSAGEQATWRALSGLVVLDVEIDVVRLDFALPGGGVSDSLPVGAPSTSPAALGTVKDPCDLLIQRGAGAFEEQLARSTGWFDFLLSALDPLEGQARWQAVDRILELLGRMPKPIQRDACLTRLAAHLGLSASAVREQFQTLASRQRRAAPLPTAPTPARPSAYAAVSGAEGESVRPAPAPRPRPKSVAEVRAERVLVDAWRCLIGAVLIEQSLVSDLEPLLRDGDSACPDPDLASLAGGLVELARREGRLPGIDGLLDAFRAHPAADWIVPLIEDASAAESARSSFDGACRKLEQMAFERRLAQQRALLPEITPLEADRREAELDSLLRDLRERGLRQAAQAQQSSSPEVPGARHTVPTPGTH